VMIVLRSAVRYQLQPALPSSQPSSSSSSMSIVPTDDADTSNSTH
jgi:hypothetical protein